MPCLYTNTRHRLVLKEVRSFLMAGFELWPGTSSRQFVPKTMLIHYKLALRSEWGYWWIVNNGVHFLRLARWGWCGLCERPIFQAAVAYHQGLIGRHQIRKIASFDSKTTKVFFGKQTALSQRNQRNGFGVFFPRGNGNAGNLLDNSYHKSTDNAKQTYLKAPSQHRQYGCRSAKRGIWYGYCAFHEFHKCNYERRKANSSVSGK